MKKIINNFNNYIVGQKVKMLIHLLYFILFILASCQTIGKQEKALYEGNSANQPNILWLVTEDMGLYLPTFGDSTIETPNLSRLAAEGIKYTNFYSPSGVCAPSRAAIATGLYPSGFGANHMRTGSHIDFTQLPPYEAVPPAEAKMMSEVLRRYGYYCTNNVKEDYQFKAPVTAWDESSPYAHWRNREEDQPFFSVFNFTVTHESGLFEPYGFRQMENRHYQAGDTSFQLESYMARMSEEETPVHIPKDLEFPIPPYLPDTEVVRRDLWKMYNNIAEMDRQVGAILKQLEEDELLDNTIIFFYADHGGPLPRQKRLIYDSGLKSPMIIRFPNQSKESVNKVDDQLISFIDLAPTVFSLAGIQPPAYLQGQAFLGEYNSQNERNYIYAAADRFDEYTDAIRAVRDKRFKYIRNYRPEQGYYLPISFREQIPTMQELIVMHKAGQLNEVQEQWFRTSKPEEELFDCFLDPHELKNLAENPTYNAKLNELRTAMDRWLDEIGDQPNLPERKLILDLWNGNTVQPQTAKPVLELKSSKVSVSCATDGASIGYKLYKSGFSTPDSWTIYTQPFDISEGVDSLVVVTHRIGYLPNQHTMEP